MGVDQAAVELAKELVQLAVSPDLEGIRLQMVDRLNAEFFEDTATPAGVRLAVAVHALFYALVAVETFAEQCGAAQGGGADDQ